MYRPAGILTHASAGRRILCMSTAMFSAEEGADGSACMPIRKWRTIVAAALQSLAWWGGEGRRRVLVCGMQGNGEAYATVEITRLKKEQSRFRRELEDLCMMHCNL
jgi:hypothetical protein